MGGAGMTTAPTMRREGAPLICMGLNGPNFNCGETAIYQVSACDTHHFACRTHLAQRVDFVASVNGVASVRVFRIGASE